MIVKPDYIGYWLTEQGMKGFFKINLKEAHQEKNSIKFTGTCKDCLGESDIKGNLNGKEVYFEKNYTKKNVSNDAIDSTIIYHGERSKTFYEGQYHSLDWKHKGIFIFENYPLNLSRTLEALLDKEFEK